MMNRVSRLCKRRDAATVEQNGNANACN